MMRIVLLENQILGETKEELEDGASLEQVRYKHLIVMTTICADAAELFLLKAYNEQCTLVDRALILGSSKNYKSYCSQ